MRTSVPMWGSTASKRWGAAPRIPAEARRQIAARLLLVMFEAAVPVAVHIVGRGEFGGAHETEAEPLGVGHVPDAFGELRVLLLPVGGGGGASGARKCFRRIVPGAAAHRVGVSPRGFDPWVGLRAGGVRSVLVERPFHDVAEHVV